MKLSKAGKLECLAVKGNYYIERNPGYKGCLISHFTGLRELDSVQITPAERNELVNCKRIRAQLLPFTFKLDTKLQ